ncbi:MAG: LysE family transporter [Deltaproteobacteria bacterium]|nr:LysE family transporter [Deltaproteobacteria bacterium]
MVVALIIGFLFGFIGSMPVAGPIAVLVFARGVENRHKSGLFIALGGALAEGIYAFLAFWGFAALLAKYSFIMPASRAAAAVVLTALGVVFLRRKTVQKDVPPTEDGWRSGFMLGFTITALNPTLIATWTAAATTLFSTGWVKFEPAMALPFGGGAIIGIASWFGLLLYLVRRYRGRFSNDSLTRIIRVMGVFLLGIAAYFAVLFVRTMLA